MIHGGSRFWERSIEKGKPATNGLVKSQIREPRNVVEVDGNSRRFLHVVSHEDAGELGLKVVTHLGEEPALNELVGSGLQIIPADLGARDKSCNRNHLSFGEAFFAFHVDFS